MYKIKSFGQFSSLPDSARWIYEGSVEAVKKALEEGMSPHDPITLSNYIKLRPLALAIIMDKLDIIRLLLDYGADWRDEENPAFLIAARFAKKETVRFLLEAGADPLVKNRVGTGVYEQAYYGNKENMELLEELGIPAAVYGGAVLRMAVSDHDLKTISWLLRSGVDINYNEPNQVYPYRATPLTVAARMNHLQLVSYLLERGADPRIQEDGGERAYSIAVVNQNREMMALLRAAEPADFHDLSNKQLELKSYKLPMALEAFLQGNDLQLDLDEGAEDQEIVIAYVRFLPYVDTIPMKHGRMKLLRISAEVENYSSMHLVWCPKDKAIGFYDEEHKTYGAMCSWEAFVQTPLVYLQGMILGEYEN